MSPLADIRTSRYEADRRRGRLTGMLGFEANPNYTVVLQQTDTTVTAFAVMNTAGRTHENTRFIGRFSWHLSRATSRAQLSLEFHWFHVDGHCRGAFNFVVSPTWRVSDIHTSTMSKFSMHWSTVQRENLDGRKAQTLSAKAFVCTGLASNLPTRSFTEELSVKRILARATESRNLNGIAC